MYTDLLKFQLIPLMQPDSNDLDRSPSNEANYSQTA